MPKGHTGLHTLTMNICKKHDKYYSGTGKGYPAPDFKIAFLICGPFVGLSVGNVGLVNGMLYWAAY